MRQFQSPHCHPQSLDSGSTPEAFLARELELGSGAICVTDHGTLASCRKIYDLAKANKITPILGVEAYFRDDNCPILLAKGVDPAKHLKYYHITLHALDQEAYYTLVRLTSRARRETHGSESKPLLTWEDLEEIGAQNVTMGSGCLVGMVQRHLLAYGDVATAEAYYQRLRSIVKPGNFFVEVFPHHCTHDWVRGVFVTLADGTEHKFTPEKKMGLAGLSDTISAGQLADQWAKKPSGHLDYFLHRRKKQPVEQQIANVRRVEGFVENECLPWTTNSNVQQACNEILLGFASKYNDPVLISDDSHYAHPEDKIVQDIRLQQGGVANWRFFGTYNRMATEEAWAYFKENGIYENTFEGWVDNNNAWASRFKDFTLVEPVSMPTKFYPDDTLAHAVALVRKQGRMQWKDPAYLARLQAEINLLRYNGSIDLLPYFFVGADVCQAYADRGLLTGPGRGSAAGLLLAYVLGITHVDPLQYGLSLDRFLTLDRIKSGKLPDIDFDFPSRDLLCEKHLVDKLEAVLEDGSVVQVLPSAVVQTTTGPMKALEALESGADVTNWGV
jgi:DNA polymerase III alpha subunit